MRFGLIGAGEIGRLRARAVRRTGGCEMVAAADPRVALAAGLGAQTFADGRELIAGADCDAVIVSTPPDSHEAIVTAALEAGRHVICEKPLARTPAACRRMVEAARARGLTLAVGFNQRHFPAIAWVKRAIERGEIGEVRYVRAYTGHRGLPEFRSGWEGSAETLGGGALMDNGMHLIDHVRYLGGEMDAVSGLTSERIWQQPGAEDNGVALMRADDGRWAMLHASWSEWRGYRFALDVHGSAGIARAAYGPMVASVTQIAERGGRGRTKRKLFAGVTLREKVQGWQSTVERTFGVELEDFMRRIGGEPVESAEGFDGFRAVEIAQAVYRSEQERTEQRLSARF